MVYDHVTSENAKDARTLCQGEVNLKEYNTTSKEI